MIFGKLRWEIRERKRRCDRGVNRLGQGWKSQRARLKTRRPRSRSSVAVSPARRPPTISRGAAFVRSCSKRAAWEMAPADGLAESFSKELPGEFLGELTAWA